MARSQDLIVRLNAETGQFDRGFKSAEASARALERELNKVEAEQRKMAAAESAAYQEMEARADASRAAMEKTGQVMLGIGATTAIGLGLAAKAAVDWETAWAGVLKTVDGSSEEMAALENELRGLTSVLPATHEEIAAVAEAAGQLGIRRQDIVGFTRTMIDLGVATNLSSAEAATSLARIGNIMGTLEREGSQGVARMGASIVALGNNSATTEREIVELSTRLAAAGRQAGMTEADVFGFSAALTSVGVEAEAGGTAMSKVFTSISDSVKDGGDKLEVFARVAGVTASEFQQAYQRDAAGAVAMFIEGLGRMQQSGESTTAVFKDLELTDQRLMRALLSTASAGDVLRDSIELSNGAWEENSALVEEANKRYQTTESRLAIARNQLNDAAIDIGANLLPALAGAADRVGALAEAFHGLPDPAKTAVTVLGGVVATVGTVGGTALIAIPKIHEFMKTLDAMGPRGATAAKSLRGVGSILAGPWGLALAGATVALGVWAEKQFQAAKRVEALAATLDTQTGAITDNTRAMVVAEAERRNLLMVAENYGLNLEMFTDALLGEKAALDELVPQLQETAKGINSMDKNTYNAAMTAGLLLDAINGQNGELAKASKEARRTAEAMGEEGDAAEDAAAPTAEFAVAASEVATTAEQAEDAIKALHEAMDAYNGIARSSIEAEMGWHKAIDDATAALEENGKTLDLSTDAGRKNMDALLSMAKAADETAEAIHRETGSEAEMRKSLEKSRQSLFETARRFGMSEDAAWEFVDAVLAVPPSAETRAVAHTEEAMRRLQAVSDKLAALDGTTSTVAVRYRETGGGTLVRNVRLAEADGGVVDYYAGGGIREQRVAQIAPAGAWRVWAEPETGGEAYIPLTPAKRERSTAVLSDVADRFGYALVQRFATGGLVSGHPVTTPHLTTAIQDAPIVINMPVQTQASPDQFVSPLLHALRVARQGGVYAAGRV